LEHTVTVLLAEDEVLIRLDVAEELRRAGWKVIEVATADDAIGILNSPVIVDLVVTDVNMPGEANGLDLARFVDRERPDIKVVIMSGHFVPGAESERAPPYDLFIPKPFLHSQLVDQLLPLLQSGKGGSQ
jgi:DNA-binding NtrC family response regulator